MTFGRVIFIAILVFLIVSELHRDRPTLTEQPADAYTEASTPDSVLPFVPCHGSLYYDIGDIDPRFNIQKSHVAEIMLRVEELWAVPFGRQIVRYHDRSNVTINFVYDEQANKIARLDERIHKKGEELAELENRLTQIRSYYQEHSDEYERLVEQRNSAVRNYNDNAHTWPSQQEQEAIAMIDRLENLALREWDITKRMLTRVNDRVDEYNILNDRRNNTIERRAALLGDSNQIVKGEYDTGDKLISIYQFNDHANLAVVLAHEIGHALGLDHVPGQNSIMNATFSTYNSSSLILSPQDINALEALCQPPMFN